MGKKKIVKLNANDFSEMIVNLMLKRLIKPILLVISTITLLGGCMHPNKVIEYDEEVKLHDGSMIWVHIKRHYVYVSAIGQGAGYIPKVVEISWDTGFPNVGRKSVFFNDYVAIIDKYNGNWYIAGEKNTSSELKISRSTNCNVVGIFITSRCIVAVNKEGSFFQPEKNDIYNIIKRNIIYPVDIKDWGRIPEPLHNTRLSWSKKLDLDKTQSKRFNGLQNPFFTGESQ
ncbi:MULTISPECIES: hypothetical protein [unclassified Acinetobacter]|uniref:hypothetical protein n=1 Tax=unclassified Acinetobacter TaxID=196816 RepID=UPI0035B891C4